MVTGLFMLSHVFDFAKGQIPPIKLLGGSSHFAFVVLSAAVKRVAPRQAPLVPFAYLLWWCVLTNLSFRDMLGRTFYRGDKTYDETSILEMSLMTHIINHNDFLTTLFVYLPLVLTSYYFQLLR